MNRSSLGRCGPSPFLYLVENPFIYAALGSKSFNGAGELGRHDPRLAISANIVKSEIQLTALDDLSKVEP